MGAQGNLYALPSAVVRGYRVVLQRVLQDVREPPWASLPHRCWAGLHRWLCCAAQEKNAASSLDLTSTFHIACIGSSQVSIRQEALAVSHSFASNSDRRRHRVFS